MNRRKHLGDSKSRRPVSPTGPPSRTENAQYHRSRSDRVSLDPTFDRSESSFSKNPSTTSRSRSDRLNSPADQSRYRLGPSSSRRRSRSRSPRLMPQHPPIEESGGSRAKVYSPSPVPAGTTGRFGSVIATAPIPSTSHTIRNQDAETEQSISMIRAIPIIRRILDPNQVTIPRRINEGITPIFDREELKEGIRLRMSSDRAPEQDTRESLAPVQQRVVAIIREPRSTVSSRVREAPCSSTSTSYPPDNVRISRSPSYLSQRKSKIYSEERNRALAKREREMGKDPERPKHPKEPERRRRRSLDRGSSPSLRSIERRREEPRHYVRNIRNESPRRIRRDRSRSRSDSAPPPPISPELGKRLHSISRNRLRYSEASHSLRRPLEAVSRRGASFRGFGMRRGLYRGTSGFRSRGKS